MTCFTPGCIVFFLSNSRICRLRQRPVAVLRFERPSHWGSRCANSRLWTSRDRTPVTIRGARGPTVRAAGVSISVARYCQVPPRDVESYLGRHPGRRVNTQQPEAKKNESEKLSQMQRPPKGL
jgi:hypothetical protein